jgi:hypothetical protein
MRVRHFGFLANRCRRERLDRIRDAIDAGEVAEATASNAEDSAHHDGWPCPKCRQGRLRPIRHIAPRTWTAGAASG